MDVVKNDCSNKPYKFDSKKYDEENEKKFEQTNWKIFGAAATRKLEVGNL